MAAATKTNQKLFELAEKYWAALESEDHTEKLKLSTQIEKLERGATWVIIDMWNGGDPYVAFRKRWPLRAAE